MTAATISTVTQMIGEPTGSTVTRTSHPRWPSVRGRTIMPAVRLARPAADPGHGRWAGPTAVQS